MEDEIKKEPKDYGLRKYVYCQQPWQYEVGSCPKCGSNSNNLEWSEFVNHLWCNKCLIDFIPDFWGIFDGPIPYNLSKMLGISFDRIEIATGKLIAFEDPEYKNTRP